ncbi:MAG: ribosomal protein S18-alanine N-acetyltransferase [Gammaproteobacteria bacterium]|nr:ribosomal protein S18-alanine N-acetyltransferase [Gammaproteobacteria bacterium]HKM27976.1 ribosomal protein S18-alanine N-acetyltransferase [Thiopseudomonas sp.]
MIDAIEFRPMQFADLEQVVALEQQAFSHPWSHKLYVDALSSYECWMMYVDGQHVGHGVISQVLDEAHLLNIAIAVEQQGRGLGLQLLEHLMQRAIERGCVECFLELRASNQSAYRLYERFGFNEIGRRRDYYPAPGGHEDALVMVCTLFAD